MNKKFEKFLNEFEAQLAYYEFQKYILNENQVVYDIGHSAIYSVLVRQEDNRDHVVVEEIFNDNSQNFKVKKFTSKYVGVWVSYFPFYGQLGIDNQFKGKSQYEFIKEKLPELEIDKRYQEWKGYGTAFAGFELIDSDKKGYDSASSQFFILTKDTSSLEGSYAGFGEVIDGMDVVDAISNVDVETRDSNSTDSNLTADKPIDPPVITSISVDTKGVDYGKPETLEPFNYYQYMMQQYYGSSYTNY